ncbi:hypothetical protein [Arachidicoccus sp.]|uniref:hypothetical protein n=1 Tax=Arachidicoccus sp. TaxID=1872624 RepID=UPI003D1D8D82
MRSTEVNADNEKNSYINLTINAPYYNYKGYRKIQEIESINLSAINKGSDS